MCPVSKEELFPALNMDQTTLVENITINLSYSSDMSMIASNNWMHPNFNKYHKKKCLLTVWFNFNIAHDEEYKQKRS